MNELNAMLEDLISLLFKKFEGVEIKTSVNFTSTNGFKKVYEADLVVSKFDSKLVIEAKLYRSHNIPLSLLNNALNRLSNLVNISRSAGGVLIITSNLEPNLRLSLEKAYNLKIWDRGILLYVTAQYSDLRQRFESILLKLLQSGEEDIFEGTNIPTEFSVDDIWIYNGQIFTVSPPSNKGNQLCDELSALKKGRKEAYKYEDKCEEILKYLFADDLTMWERQSRTGDSLHKFDLISKIASKNDFWRVLARDFRSRFVIFEFKNYTNKIKQGQVYSTEKYLYSTALRTIAIILSREGAEKNAILAMDGSLREQGKLIICLDQNELCMMLNKKDSGDDPNAYLSDKIDSILMKLSR